MFISNNKSLRNLFTNNSKSLETDLSDSIILNIIIFLTVKFLLTAFILNTTEAEINKFY